MGMNVNIGNSEREVAILAQQHPNQFPTPAGLLTLTTPFDSYHHEFVEFVNSDLGTEMNVNAPFSGTPVQIHNGTDNVYWTALDVIGSNVTANSADQANGGTNSCLIDTPGSNDVWEFDKGSSQSIAHVALALFIYVDKNWTTDSVEVYGWDGTIEVGNRVKLEDYFPQSSFDTWHALIIPLDDMGLVGESITGFRMQYVTKTGPSVKFYIDDMLLEELGGGAEFKVVAPFRDRPYRVNKVILSFSDVLAGTVTDGTMPGIAYDDILGVATLTNGILFAHKENGAFHFQEQFKGIGDLFSFGFKSSDMISDGTNTYVSMEMDFPEPIVLRGQEDENYLSISVRDDLTGLLSLVGRARGGSLIVR